MMFACILLALVAMDDVKLCFRGGEALRNEITAPSTSTRLGATIPEMYGTISGYLERLQSGQGRGTADWPDDILGLKTNYVWYLDGLINNGAFLQTNRVVSSRPYLWRSICSIPDSMQYGPIALDGDVGYSVTVGSSRFRGTDFPNIEWTDHFARDFLDAGGLDVWPTLDELPIDGLWKRSQGAERTGSGICAEAIRFATGANRREPDSETDRAIALIEGRTFSVSCLDLLRGAIDDQTIGVAALTNRTTRINLNQLTSIAHAIALLDTSFYLGELYCDPKNVIKDFSAEYSRGRNGVAAWSYDPLTSMMYISGLASGWDAGSGASAENLLWESGAGDGNTCVASFSGISGKSFARANATDSARILADYTNVVSAVVVGSTAGIVTQQVVSVGHHSSGSLAFTLANGESFAAGIPHSGTNSFACTAHADLSCRVSYPAPPYTCQSYMPYGFGSGAMTDFWWDNGYCESNDEVVVMSCAYSDRRYVSDEWDIYSGWYDALLGDERSEIEGASYSEVGFTSRAAISNFLVRCASIATDHCLEMVSEAAGGDIRSGLLSVARAADATTEAIADLSRSASSGFRRDPVVEVADGGYFVYDPATGDLRAFKGGGEFYDVSRGEPIQVGLLDLSYEVSATTNGQPASAAVLSRRASRTLWRFRNLRLQD